MYCPQCATQNTDNAKFCRACGTDLEAVALVLTNKFPLPGAWLEQYGEGKHKVIRGAAPGSRSIDRRRSGTIYWSEFPVGDALDSFFRLDGWLGDCFVGLRRRRDG